MLVYNTALADEICALNAIYGDGTITPTFSDSDHTTISLRLFDLSYSFLLHIAQTYPQSIPKVLGIDDLMQSRHLETQQNAAYFQACFLSVHRPDGVCIFDAVEEFEPIFHMQQIRHASSLEGEARKLEDMERLKALRDLVNRARLGVLPPSTSLPDPNSSDIVDCAGCMDPFFRVDTANLQCRHSYCRECLADGLMVGFRDRSEFMCCGKSIPTKIVQGFAGMEEEMLEIYLAYLKERHTPNPLYCPYEHCSSFIPKLFIKADRVICPFCKKRLCGLCRQKDHRGMCKGDSKLAKLVKEGNWQFCPQCGHLVERTVGCNHMSCVCGAHFCYRCGKKDGCDCGLFEGPG